MFQKMEQNKIIPNYLAEEEDDDEEEALSLSDLPLIHNSETSSRPSRSNENTPEDSDFDFCSLSKQQHEMCAADDVFFQGKILPLRHSDYRSRISRSISRSESMDHYYSGSGFISSRSSSMSSSHQSSSSSGGAPKFKPKFNQFHSHPSPSPRIMRFPPNTNRNRNHSKKSSIWNVFRLGLVTPPAEIAFQDLKSRANNKNFGSRNSTSSNNSSVNSVSNGNKKNKRRSLSLNGCKCSADAVRTVPSRVVIIKRSASEGDIEEENVSAKMAQKRASKKHLSHNRTFEWLKQLSIEGPAEES